MNDDADEENIQDFLTRAKDLLYKESSFELIPRKKNFKCFTITGLDLTDAKIIINSLTIGDYITGPEDDIGKGREGFIWVFKKKYFEYSLYIKLKIEYVDNVEMLKCISFHLDEEGK